VTRSHHRKGDLTRTSVNNIQFSKFVSLSQRQLFILSGIIVSVNNFFIFFRKHLVVEADF